MDKIFFIVLLICSSAELAAQQTAKSVEHKSTPFHYIGYLEYLPPGYQDAAEKFPVLIYLHGGGEAGDGSPAALEKVKSWGPPSHIQAGHDMCFTVNQKQECFIVISPQMDPVINYWPTYLPTIIEHIMNEYKADPDRIYLSGLSRGGNGVYSYASSLFNEPNKLAAIAPIAAWADANMNGCHISRSRINVWAFHGKEDTVVPVSMGLSAFDRITTCATPAPVAEMVFTLYEDYGKYHDAWLPAYDPGHTYHDPNLYEWFLSKKLDKNEDGAVTGLSEDIAGDAFSIFPNPSGDYIDVFSDEHSTSDITIRIVTLTGKTVKKVQGNHRLYIADLATGAYLVQLKSGSGIITTKRLLKTQ